MKDDLDKETSTATQNSNEQIFEDTVEFKFECQTND